MTRGGGWKANISPGGPGLLWDTLLMLLAIDAGTMLIRVLRRAPANPASAPLYCVASGATAASPIGIPARGARQILLRVFARIGEDRVMAEAASVTYYTLLAIFPALAALISLYGLVADPATIGRNLSAISLVVPGGGMQIISDQIHTLTATPNRALGFGAVIGLLTSIWSANAGVKSLSDALNAVYGTRETRGFFHRTWLSLGFTLGALLFVLLAMSAVVVLPAVLADVGLGTWRDALLTAGRWPVLLLAVMLFLALTYRYGPCRAAAKWRWLSWGSAFAAIVWLLASAGFSWYVGHFGSYNKTYGSLGAAVGFMTWIWISTIIMLVGAELDAELDQRRPATQCRDDIMANGRAPAGVRARAATTAA
jgi:membrane protein